MHYNNYNYNYNLVMLATIINRLVLVFIIMLDEIINRLFHEKRTKQPCRSQGNTNL